VFRRSVDHLTAAFVQSLLELHRISYLALSEIQAYSHIWQSNLAPAGYEAGFQHTTGPQNAEKLTFLKHCASWCHKVNVINAWY